MSWKRRSYPRLIIRYEDLISDQYQYFEKILNFVNDFKKINIDELKIKKTIELCKLENLSKLEDQVGFEEKLKKEKKFFRKGLVDEWKSQLNKDQIKKIENAFFEEMRELKYL